MAASNNLCQKTSRVGKRRPTVGLIGYFLEPLNESWSECGFRRRTQTGFKELSGKSRASLNPAMPLSKLTSSSLACAALATR